MKQLELKYGCNPNQKPACVYCKEGELPIQMLNGNPGYINLLDALNAWQLVQELQQVTKLPAAASFKHVSPAGAAVGLALTPLLRSVYFVPENLQLSALACAYARARGADRVSSYGDFAALSDICDESTALLLKPEVSDGVIAPGYTPEALEILKQKRRGTYNILAISPQYQPPQQEEKDVFGVTFRQGRQDAKIGEELLQNMPTQNATLSKEQKRDLLVALITLKYTQSNSVCYTKDGQAIGVGAGQQSRIHCTRLAGGKADNWHLRQHPKVLGLHFAAGIGRAERDNAIDLYLSEDAHYALVGDGWKLYFAKEPVPFFAEEKREYLARVKGVSMGSDAFFPFGDNIERAHKSGVVAIAQPGGSIRDDHVIAACDKHGIAMAFTGLRLFHH
ncbi:MAG: phosphoribosylaminoimidazolecarboxamide formyltransferase [Oscillospiraceae bacterium]